MSRRLAGCGRWSAEDAVHDGGAVLDDRAQLLAIDGLGDRGPAGVPDEAGDLFDGHARVGEQRDEAVAQLAGCPVGGIEPGRGRDAAEPASDVGRVQRACRRRRRRRGRCPASGLLRRAGPPPGGLGVRAVHRRSGREGQGAAGLAGLGVAAGADGAPDHDVRRDRWCRRRAAVEVDVAPGQRPQFLGTGAGEQRHAARRRPSSTLSAARTSAWACSRVSALDGRPVWPVGVPHSSTTLRWTLSRAWARVIARRRMDLRLGDGAGAQRRGLLREPSVDVVGGEVDAVCGRRGRESRAGWRGCAGFPRSRGRGRCSP